MGLFLAVSFIVGGPGDGIHLAMLRQKSAAIDSCRRLIRPEDTSSKRLTLRWVISEAGEVERLRVDEPELRHNPTAECLLSEISTWRYRKPSAAIFVMLPIPL